MFFKVEITETRQFVVEVNAHSEEDAIAQVQEAYENDILEDVCANNSAEFTIFEEE